MQTLVNYEDIVIIDSLCDVQNDQSLTIIYHCTVYKVFVVVMCYYSVCVCV